MAYSVELAADAREDLAAIHDFLVDSYMAFGEDTADSLDRADVRIGAIGESLRALGDVPAQGTLRPEIRGGLRNVTKDRAIIYFDVDDDAQVVRILAVFYGGQDHQRHMLERALSR